MEMKTFKWKTSTNRTKGEGRKLLKKKVNDFVLFSKIYSSDHFKFRLANIHSHLNKIWKYFASGEIWIYRLIFFTKAPLFLEPALPFNYI